MKDLVINCSFLSRKVTGLERYAISLSRQFKLSYPRTTFVSPGNVRDEALAQELGVKRFGSLSGHLWEQWDLPGFLKRKNNPLLLNPANTGPLFYRNHATVIHDVSFISHPEWFSRAFRLFYGPYIRRMAKTAGVIFTDSQFSRQEINSRLDLSGQKTHVAYPGLPREIMELAAREYRNPHGDYILTVSSLDPRKNIGRLVEAFAKLSLPDTKLIVVGAPNPLVFSGTGLGRGMAKGQNVVFKGYVPDQELVALYKNARLFVYLSLYEGFGFPPLEAMACGCPVLVSNRASLPEVCGPSAEYVDPLSVEDITRKILFLLEQDRERITRDYLGQVTLFSWERSVKCMIDALAFE
jgi:glycosyltransferase involved in cell wall biosynthesis